jgi:hypothetical protein
MADFLITSTRGGQNEDDPASIPDDCCTNARNVEWWQSQLGERRKGCDAIDIGSPFTACERIVWKYRHLPTTDPADAQLWALGINDTGPAAVLAYKDTTWHTVTMGDALTIDGVSEYQVQGQTLHGKLFLAYNSSVDRLHVFITGDTALRRTGIAEPAAAPTGANSGVPGTALTGTRYYRVRFIEKSGSTILRRSEPSAVLTFAPSGTGTTVVVTRPAAVSEGETHWELEASLDNANFYVLATTVLATTTANDTIAFTTGYAASGYELSEDIGDYELIPSVRFLTAEQDRLMGGGSFEDSALASRVLWTPVYGDPGDGNDERVPLDTTNFLNLDGFEGGPLTGLSATVNGYVYATKQSHVYQLTRRGVRTQAYEAIPLTKQRGAIYGSLVEAFDMTGNPTPFFLDPDIGACLIGPRGVEPCGADLRVTWETVNLDATKIVARSLYYPVKKQVLWSIATGTSNVPDLGLTLHTHAMRQTADGWRGGWAVWDGGRVEVLSMCLFADNIDAAADRSNVLVPFIGIEGGDLILRTDTGDDDNGTAYAASETTKPYIHGSLLNQFECQSGALLAKAATGGVIDVTLTGNFGLIEKVVSDVTLDATDDETYVVKTLDDLGLAELRTLQVTFADPTTPGGQWSLAQFAMKEVKGAGA